MKPQSVTVTTIHQRQPQAEALAQDSQGMDMPLDMVCEAAPPGHNELANVSSGDLEGSNFADLNNELLDELGEVRSVVEANSQLLGELMQRDTLLGQLHHRLAAYEQDDRLRSFVEPLTRKITSVHRRLLEQLSHTRGVVKNLPKPLRAHSAYYWAHSVLDSIRAELETILSDFGVETFICEHDRFDRSRQEAVERIPAAHAKQVGTIARRIAPGFRLEERIIIAERVAVFVEATHRTNLRTLPTQGA